MDLIQSLPEEVQLKILEYVSFTPLSTIVPCCETQILSADFYLFESDYPLTRTIGRFRNEKVELLCDIDNMIELCPELEGTRRSDADSNILHPILKKGTDLYMFTSKEQYIYNRIGSINKIKHKMKSVLRCTSKHYANLPCDYIETNCVFPASFEIVCTIDSPVHEMLHSVPLKEMLQIVFKQKINVLQRAHMTKVKSEQKYD